MSQTKIKPGTHSPLLAVQALMCLKGMPGLAVPKPVNAQATRPMQWPSQWRGHLGPHKNKEEQRFRSQDQAPGGRQQVARLCHLCIQTGGT